MFGWRIRSRLGRTPIGVTKHSFQAFLLEVAPQTSRGGAAAATADASQSRGFADRYPSRLEAELVAAGYPASTRPIVLAGAPMFEVRTGPYSTREVAEIDVARIRQMPGYADARVIPRAPAAQ